MLPAPAPNAEPPPLANAAKPPVAGLITDDGAAWPKLDCPPNTEVVAGFAKADCPNAGVPNAEVPADAPLVAPKAEGAADGESPLLFFVACSNAWYTLARAFFTQKIMSSQGS